MLRHSPLSTKKGTNNEAEFRALRDGLLLCQSLGISDFFVEGTQL